MTIFGHSWLTMLPRVALRPQHPLEAACMCLQGTVHWSCIEGVLSIGFRLYFGFIRSLQLTVLNPPAPASLFAGKCVVLSHPIDWVESVLDAFWQADTIFTFCFRLSSDFSLWKTQQICPRRNARPFHPECVVHLAACFTNNTMQTLTVSKHVL